MHNTGHVVSHRLTAAEVTELGLDAAGGLIEVVGPTGQPTGVVYAAGAQGVPPSELLSTLSSGTPANLAGTGTIELTQSTHGGRAWHIVSGQTVILLDAIDWPVGGEMSLINHSGSSVPINLGTGWTAGYVNNVDGATVVTGTLITLQPKERVVIQVKGASDVNVAVVGGPVQSVAGQTGDVVLTNTDVGLGNVTNDAQLKIASNLSDLQSAATARTNLGLGTAAVKDAPAVGNAIATEVVLGSDSRLTDARTPTAHTHPQSDVTNLVTDLAAKAPLASPTLTGVPTSPTAAADTNTTQIATTAFVIGQAATTLPNMDSVASVGVSSRFSRGDHTHPSDTTKAPLASPALTGVPTSPTAAPGTNTTQIATTEFVQTAVNATRSYLKGMRSTAQTSPVTAGSAIAFDTIVASFGSDISLNTSTGRITLAAGKTYKLEAAVPAANGATDPTVQFGFYNVTTSAVVGAAQNMYGPGNAENRLAGGIAQAVIVAGVSTDIEFRIISISAGTLTSIGDNPDFTEASMNRPWVMVEVL